MITSSNGTVDSKHKEQLAYYNKIKLKVIPSLQSKHDDILTQIKSFAQEDINELLSLKHSLKQLSTEINKHKREYRDYFKNNTRILGEYFQNKQNTSNNIIKNNNNNNTILSFFNQSIDNESTSLNQENNNNNTDINHKSLDDIIFKYFSNLNISIISTNSSNLSNNTICSICNAGELCAIIEDGIVACLNCNNISPYLVMNECSGYKEPPKELSSSAYKRINHFKEILSQFQGKESTNLPEQLIIKLKKQIKKEKMDITKLSYNAVKSLLKQIELRDDDNNTDDTNNTNNTTTKNINNNNEKQVKRTYTLNKRTISGSKFNEHIQFIRIQLDIPVLQLSFKLENTLINMFITIQPYFSVICPDERVNFIRYHYTLYKLLELLEEHEYLADIHLIKEVNLYEQDQLWKKICNLVKWKYVPTKSIHHIMQTIDNNNNGASYNHINHDNNTSNKLSSFFSPGPN